MMARKNRRFLNKTGQMRCDICNLKTRLVQHHINGRNIKDPHNRNNLCNICDNCHRKIHENEIIVEGWFMSTDGLILLWKDVA